MGGDKSAFNHLLVQTVDYSSRPWIASELQEGHTSGCSDLDGRSCICLGFEGRIYLQHQLVPLCFLSLDSLVLRVYCQQFHLLV